MQTHAYIDVCMYFACINQRKRECYLTSEIVDIRLELDMATQVPVQWEFSLENKLNLNDQS